MIIFKKLNTLRKGIHKKGFIGFFRYFFLDTDNDFVGRYVELRGNRVQIENLHIFVDSPAVFRHNKSQLLQGRYEKPERDAIKKYLNRSLPVIELGGSIGVVACMTNRLLENPTHHIVVEANPNMAITLEKNREKNQCHFQIIQRAIGYQSDVISLYQMGFSSSIHHVSESEIQVKTISLREVLKEIDWQRFSLVCDIEGAEVELIAHEKELLKNRVSMIIIELHPDIVGQDEIDNTLDVLKNSGFQKLSQENNVYVFRNSFLL